MMPLAIFFNTVVGNILEVLFLVVLVGTIVVVITENRNPLKTLSWVMILIFLPVVGLFLYFIFGQDTRKERVIGKRSLSKLMQKPLLNYRDCISVALPPTYVKLIHMMKKANQAYPLDGNRVKVYTAFPSLLPDLLRSISEAQHHIHIQFYIFMDDAVGRLVRDALIDKARQGVKIRFLYDDVGCWSAHSRFYKEMEAYGIEVYPFLEVKFPMLTRRVNYRNHRKILVIDGKVGYMGGMNVADRYYHGVSWGVWRDTHIRIEGMSVCALQTSFLTDWYFASRKLVTQPVYFPKIASQGRSLLQIVSSGPMSEWKEIMQGLLQAIGQSRSYLYIQTPYFLPTEPIMMALRNAALAGVDVRLMVPRRSDSVVVHLASRSYLKDAMRAGVKVYFYEKGFLHAKMIVSDDNFATVGSTNIDFRSFEHNFEINAFIYDPELVKQLKTVFLKDQNASIRVDSHRWFKRSRWIRFWESLARLLSPIL